VIAVPLALEYVSVTTPAGWAALSRLARHPQLHPAQGLMV